MFGSFLSALGGQLGEAFGGGMLSSIGKYAGRLFGSYIDTADRETEERTSESGRVLDNLYVQSSSYGKLIPLIYGKARIAGNVIWSEPIEEIINDNTSYKYFSKSHKEVITHNYEFRYYISFAIGICEGEIDRIERVWVGDDLLDLSLYKHTIYKGTETQLPDSLIEKNLGANKTPAFRGLCYIIFEKLPLAEFGNRLPNLSFEIIKTPKIPELNGLEQILKSIIMIPGSGEYVYDPIIQYKIKSYHDIQVEQEAINCHNKDNIADALYTLNSLQSICPNIEWVAPVVCWFGSSLDIGNCSIYPAVEFSDESTKLSEKWQVAGHQRQNAKLISLDQYNNPNYGGTINDLSLIRYIDELARRKLKVLFYPMFLLDIPGKPWRGNVKGDANSIVHFFNKPDGYNAFILHYARLMQGKVDAFIIGSELKGITSITNSPGHYQSVKELVLLAKKVKEILGSEVIITYAADWSEYHNHNGWHHLDELWGSDYIDVVGIDAYFPLTDTTESIINEQDIKDGWSSGEGYHYYYTNEGVETKLNPDYAWKNINHWWEAYHYQPNGDKTVWQPKSKKIWFTEYGFPSIDKATNQPNVFYDPKSLDGGIPKHSTGSIDFMLQRKAIKASIEAGKNFQFLDNMFLWCWDARPYPVWPHGMFWSDGYLWERGHWVSGKLGQSSLAAIIIDLCTRSGISIANIDVSEIEETINGLIFDNYLNISDAIHILRCAYFFDFSHEENCIRFRKRGAKVAQISCYEHDIIPEMNYSINSYNIAESYLPKIVKVGFIDEAADYSASYAYTYYDFPHSSLQYIVRLPLILNENEASAIASNILLNSRSEYINFTFNLSIKYISLKPADLILFRRGDLTISMRVMSLTIQGIHIKVNSVLEKVNSYLMNVSSVQMLPKLVPITRLITLNIPLIYPGMDKTKEYMLFALQGSVKENLYFSTNNSEYIKIAELRSNVTIGKLVVFDNKFKTLGLIDNSTEVVIFLEKDLLSINEDDFWAARTLLFIGKEIISYRNLVKIKDRLYSFKGLIRGRFGSIISSDRELMGEEVYIFSNEAFTLPICDIEDGKELWFKTAIAPALPMKFTTTTQALPAPIITNYKLENNIITINWCSRNNYSDDWKSPYLSLVKRYIINISTVDETITIHSLDENIIIDFRKLAINGDVKIFIIAQGNDLKNSPPAILNAKVQPLILT